MKIKMLVSMAGPEVVWDAGTVVDIDDAEAARLLAAEYAEPVEVVERATAKKRETATAPAAGDTDK